jgi:hypothetical protein
MGIPVVPEPCQESRRVDYATAVFISATDRHQHETFDFGISLAEELNDQLSWKEAGRSPHFERVFNHDLGFRLEMTPLRGSNGRNPGMTVITMPGAAFYLQTSEEQALMLWKVTHQDGFKWFTRLDFQNTELEPAVDVDHVHQGVSDGEYWVKGHGTWRPYGDMDAEGHCPGGRTLYWGSPRAERQGRTYDKAKQSGWGTPAIRDEVQLRGEWAHTYGRTLKQALRDNLTSEAMAAAVADLAADALNHHLQYWELNGVNPKTDKNWTRKAQVADWYAERIGKASEPIKKAPRPALDLESTVSWGVQQYGRLFALWVAKQCQDQGLGFEEAKALLWERFYCRLKPEDAGAWLSLPAGADVPVWREELRDAQNAMALHMEGLDAE